MKKIKGIHIGFGKMFEHVVTDHRENINHVEVKPRETYAAEDGLLYIWYPSAS